jgi:hypothetical protein
VVVELTNGCTFAFPPRLARGMERATEDELAQVEALGTGHGLHWEALDADLSIPGLLASLLGTTGYMARRGPPYPAAAGQQHHTARGYGSSPGTDGQDRRRHAPLARHLRGRRAPPGRRRGTSPMTADGPATLDRIRRHLVGLRMPRALEVLEHLLRQLERGEISAIEAIDALLHEELSLREGRRVKAALKMSRLVNVKTLAGFDFAFQPSLDRSRILTLAGLDFIDRHEVVHFLGQPGCGKTRLAIALAVEAMKAGRSVYLTTLAELIGPLAKAEREGALREGIRFLCRPQLLVVDGRRHCLRPATCPSPQAATCSSGSSTPATSVAR